MSDENGVIVSSNQEMTKSVFIDSEGARECDMGVNRTAWRLRTGADPEERPWNGHG